MVCVMANAMLSTTALDGYENKYLPSLCTEYFRVPPPTFLRCGKDCPTILAVPSGNGQGLGSGHRKAASDEKKEELSFFTFSPGQRTYCADDYELYYLT